MESKSAKYYTSLGIIWGLASLGMFIIAIGIFQSIVKDLDILLYFLTSSIFVGGLMGTIQWIILRKHIPDKGWWILVSMLGYLIGGIVFYFGLLLIIPPLSFPPDFSLLLLTTGIVGAIIGLSIGGLQGLVLVRHLPGRSKWLLANIIGHSLGSIMCQIVVINHIFLPVYSMFESRKLGALVQMELQFISGGIIPAVATALALVSILKNNRRAQ